MSKKNEGSALIVVLVIMTFIAILAASLVPVTHSEEIMAKSYNDWNSAYYIAEAGIERSLHIIKKELTPEFINSKLLSDARLNNDKSISKIQTVLDEILRDYFTNNFKNSIELYQKYVAKSDGKLSPNGIDTMEFSQKNGILSYYSISYSISEASKIKSDYNEYSIPITIISTGHYGKSVRTIISKHILSGTINVTTPEDNNYDDLDIYSRNAITAIGGTDTSSNNNFTGGIHSVGNVLLVGNLVNVNGAFRVDPKDGSGNIAIKANSIDFNSSLAVYNGDMIADIQGSSKTFGSALLSGGNFYSNVDMYSLTRRNISLCYDNSWWGNIIKDSRLLTTDKENIRSNFKLKQIDANILKAKLPGIDVIYLDSPNAVIDDGKYKSSYYLIVSNGNVEIDVSKFKKPAFIYCSEKLTINGSLDMRGLIIAKSIQANGSLKVSYEDPSGNEKKLQAIVDALKESAVTSSTSSVNFTNYKITCSVWNQ